MPDSDLTRTKRESEKWEMREALRHQIEEKQRLKDAEKREL